MQISPVFCSKIMLIRLLLKQETFTMTQHQFVCINATVLRQKKAHLYVLDPDPYLSIRIRIQPASHNTDPTDPDPHYCSLVPAPAQALAKY